MSEARSETKLPAGKSDPPGAGASVGKVRKEPRFAFKEQALPTKKQRTAVGASDETPRIRLAIPAISAGDGDKDVVRVSATGNRNRYLVYILARLGLRDAEAEADAAAAAATGASRGAKVGKAGTPGDGEAKAPVEASGRVVIQACHHAIPVAVTLAEIVKRKAPAVAQTVRIGRFLDNEGQAGVSADAAAAATAAAAAAAAGEGAGEPGSKMGDAAGGEGSDLASAFAKLAEQQRMAKQQGARGPGGKAGVKGAAAAAPPKPVVDRTKPVGISIELVKAPD